MFTHYSIFIALFFSIFSTLCSHQPPMVHQGHKKVIFFLPKFMALVSRKISLFTLFFGISKKYNVAKKKKTKDLMWILWKKPVWSSILNDPAWWRAFHNKPIFEKNVQFRELYSMPQNNLQKYKIYAWWNDHAKCHYMFFFFFKNIANYLLYYFSFFS